MSPDQLHNRDCGGSIRLINGVGGCYIKCAEHEYTQSSYSNIHKKYQRNEMTLTYVLFFLGSSAQQGEGHHRVCTLITNIQNIICSIFCTHAKQKKYSSTDHISWSSHACNRKIPRMMRGKMGDVHGII